jgi:nucleoside-diphosphate-sugar epimerase
MRTLIVGSSSNLSRALQQYCFNFDEPFDLVSTELLKYWIENSSGTEIEALLESKTLSGDVSRIVYAAGLTNPQFSPRVLETINVDLPLRIARLFSTSEVIVMFPGAFMENFPRFCRTSVYLSTKLTFAQRLEQISGNWINLRFNQWYGMRELRSHLFLGQAIDSIRNRREFSMSDGMQLREYHHIEDDVRVFFHCLENSYQSHVDVTHGEFLRLRDLASELFESFQSSHLLQLGKLKTNPDDNFDRYFPYNLKLSGLNFRKTREGILDYASSVIRRCSP